MLRNCMQGRSPKAIFSIFPCIFPCYREILGLSWVRLALRTQPPSPDTPGNFHFEKFVPTYPRVSRATLRAEHKLMPICSRALPISSASL